MPSFRTLVEVVDQIYEAALDPAGLDQLALNIARFVNAESAALAFNKMPPRGSRAMPSILGLLSATDNVDAWARVAYAEHYHDRDVWFRASMMKPMPVVMLGGELVDDRTLLRSEWYDFCQKVDAFHLLAAHFPLSETVSVQLGAHRPRCKSAFDEADRRKLELLLPHLQRALQVHSRLNMAEGQRLFALDVLADLDVAIIIVAKDRSLLFANKAAERVLARQNDFTISRGKLILKEPAQKAELERLIFAATEVSAGRANDAGGLFILRSAERTLSILVSPIHAPKIGFEGFPVAALIFSDPDKTFSPLRPEYVLRRAYSVTPAEARLVVAVGAGENLRAYAGRCGITLNTAKTQLRQVFAKTGCARQADLVRVLHADSALRLALMQTTTISSR